MLTERYSAHVPTPRPKDALSDMLAEFAPIVYEGEECVILQAVWD